MLTVVEQLVLNMINAKHIEFVTPLRDFLKLLNHKKLPISLQGLKNAARKEQNKLKHDVGYLEETLLVLSDNPTTIKRVYLEMLDIGVQSREHQLKTVKLYLKENGKKLNKLIKASSLEKEKRKQALSCVGALEEPISFLPIAGGLLVGGAAVGLGGYMYFKRQNPKEETPTEKQEEEKQEA